MSTITGVWELIQRIVQAEGLRLFDIDLPGRDRGTLRVYLAGAEKVSAVEIEECARVNRRLRDSEELEAVLPGDFIIEVSSPGINRRLRRPEHYAGAVGERVDVTYREAPQPDQVTGVERKVVGKLSAFDGSALVVVDEKSQLQINVPLESLRKAQVSFEF